MLILIVLHSYFLTLEMEISLKRKPSLTSSRNCLSKKELTVFFFLALQIRPESLSTLLEIVPYIDTFNRTKRGRHRTLANVRLT